MDERNNGPVTFETHTPLFGCFPFLLCHYALLCSLLLSLPLLCAHMAAWIIHWSPFTLERFILCGIHTEMYVVINRMNIIHPAWSLELTWAGNPDLWLHHYNDPYLFQLQKSTIISLLQRCEFQIWANLINVFMYFEAVFAGIVPEALKGGGGGGGRIADIA